MQTINTGMAYRMMMVKHGLRSSDVAKKVESTRQCVSNWLYAESQSTRLIERNCNKLGWDIAEFMSFAISSK